MYSSLKSKETICPLSIFDFSGFDNEYMTNGPFSSGLDDHTTISFTFDNLYAEAGPGVSVANNRRNCQISVGVE